MSAYAVGSRWTFRTPYEQYREHDGKACSVTRAITEPDANHDAESLPMYVVLLDGGMEIEAWPEELKSQ